MDGEWVGMPSRGVGSGRWEEQGAKGGDDGAALALGLQHGFFRVGCCHRSLRPGAEGARGDFFGIFPLSAVKRC